MTFFQCCIAYGLLPGYIFALTISILAILVIHKKPSDPYGLFHLSLNKGLGDPSHTLPETEWLNMGYWKNAKSFPDACRALALKLISASKLEPGGHVLDVGFGTGESLILLLSDPAVPRPSRLVGITSLPLQCQRARIRVQHSSLQRRLRGKVHVKLFTSDAISDGLVKEHPLHPSSQSCFDAILALDCAYHFNTRQQFMIQSYRKLRPQGRIALADICFSPSTLSFRMRLFTSLVKLVPDRNRITAKGYVAQMQDIGFEDVVLEDITSDVFPGFIDFLKGRGWGWWLFSLFLEWYLAAGVQFIIISGSMPDP